MPFGNLVLYEVMILRRNPVKAMYKYMQDTILFLIPRFTA